MRVDDQLAERFVCTKCKQMGGKARRFAAPGTGFTRLLDLQHNRFIAVSCNYCGYTEVYNPVVLEGKKSRLGDILDLLFGS